MRSFLLFASSLAVLCGGCGMVPNRYSAAKLDLSARPEEAVALLSAGAPERCITNATQLELRQDGRFSNVAYLPVDNYAVPSDFTTHHGYLHAVRLSPGRYYLSPHIANPYVTIKKVPRIDFTVSAGEVVYLGEFFLVQSCGSENLAELRDREERDLALLREKNPALAAAPIVKRIPVFASSADGRAQ